MELCVSKFCMIFCKNVFTEWKIAFYTSLRRCLSLGKECNMCTGVSEENEHFVLLEDKHMNENFMCRKGCLGFLFEICLCLHCCIKLSVWKLDRVFDLMVRENEFTPPPSSVS